MPARVILIAISLLLAACGTTAPPVTAAPTTTEPDVPSSTVPAITPCSETSGRYFGEGPIGTVSNETADASTVTGIVLEAFGDCERLTIEFAAPSGAPATALGTADAQLNRQAGVISVHLDEAVNATTVSDIIFDSDLADRAYVVRDFDGSVYVDIHLATESLGRFTGLTNPPRLVVDLTPGGSEVGSPHRSDFVVVMPIGETTTAGTEIVGYGRTFEASVVLRIRQNGELVAETFTTASDYIEMWGAFRLEIPAGVTGPAEVFIGEDSARDGSEQGVNFLIDIAG